MKRPSIHDLVFRHQFPSPKQNEPQNFYAHVQRNLVPEVRVEVQTFYGALDSLEAQYPGLDYTHDPHRRRLGRFPWHRRLFRTFDQLRLTDDEVLSICQWEGTKSAKDKYEAETGRSIHDTTADDVAPPERSSPSAVVHRVPRRQPSTETMAHVGGLDDHSIEEDQSEDDDDIEVSVGVQLNDQLMAVEEGDSPSEGPLEEWLKYMHERDVNRDSVLQAIRAGHPPPTVLENIRASAAMSSSEAVVSASSNMMFPPLRSIPTTSQHSYGLANEEMLASLQERRVQA